MNNKQLYNKIESMNNKTFKNEFSDLMSKCRFYNPRIIKKIAMSFNIKDNKIVDKHYTPLQRGSYVNTNKQYTIRVSCERFLSYEKMKEEILYNFSY